MFAAVTGAGCGLIPEPSSAPEAPGDKASIQLRVTIFDVSVNASGAGDDPKPGQPPLAQCTESPSDPVCLAVPRGRLAVKASAPAPIKSVRAYSPGTEESFSRFAIDAYPKGLPPGFRTAGERSRAEIRAEPTARVTNINAAFRLEYGIVEISGTQTNDAIFRPFELGVSVSTDAQTSTIRNVYVVGERRYCDELGLTAAASPPR